MYDIKQQPAATCEGARLDAKKKVNCSKKEGTPARRASYSQLCFLPLVGNAGASSKRPFLGESSVGESNPSLLLSVTLACFKRSMSLAMVSRRILRSFSRFRGE